ncbi:MAG: O-antigen ligase family protein [Actinomycetota bacterium]
MIVAPVLTRAQIGDGQGEVLGPIASFGARSYLFVAMVFAFGVTGFEVFPGPTPLALLVGVAGVLVLAPKHVLMRLPVSPLVLTLVAWTAASVWWTDSPPGTAFAMMRLLPILLGVMVVAGVAAIDDVVAALLWAIRVSVVATLAVLALVPETRIHIDPSGQAPPLDGWHGWFAHKNIMTPYLVFGLLTVLTFDRTVVVRWSTLALIGVLLVGSDSVTGISSALLAVSIWVWLQLYRHLDLRNSSVFVVSSVSVAVFALASLVATLSTLTSASGRDLTFTGRTFIWQATFDAIVERPVLGYGLGGVLFDDPVSPRTAEIWRAIGFEVPHAHNGLLDLALQLGVVGCVLFVLLFGATMLGGVAMIREQPTVGAWIVSVLVVQLYMSLSEDVFLGNGWLPVLVLFRVLQLRSSGVDWQPDRELSDRVRARVGRGSSGAGAA